MLKNKCMTLVSPEKWDDRNDSYYLDIYREKNNLSDIYALCFSEKNETYHHWKVFSSRDNGVCIIFDRNKLIDHFESIKNISYASVNYKTIPGVNSIDLTVNELPFLKRYAFKDEAEFRAIYTGESTTEGTIDIPLPISCISKIILNPWIHDQLFFALKDIIKSIDGCKSLPVGKSKLIDNNEWKRNAFYIKYQ